MEETFYSDKYYYRLKYESGTFEWRNLTEETDKKTLQLECEVLAFTPTTCSERIPSPYYLGFVVHYIDKIGPNYKYGQKCFAKLDSDVVKTWFNTLNDFIKGIGRRPKCILLFLNPNAGCKKALAIYTKKAKPYFALANVRIELIVTERPRYVQEYLTANGWPPETDGIVAFGGDGTLCEVINGVVSWTAYTSGANINSPDLKIRSPAIRIGIVPAGSTDTVSFSLHKTSDVETAVFHIILGNSLSMDVGIVHNENKFLSCCCSVLSFGFLAEVIESSEGLRCLGPIRYEISGFWNVIKNKKYRGKFILSTGAYDTQNTDDESKESRMYNSSLTVPSNQYFMVSAANISCSSTRSPNGLAPQSQLNDGLFNVVIVQNLSLLQKIQFFRTLAGRTQIINNLPFVKVHKTNKIVFEADVTAADSTGGGGGPSTSSSDDSEQAAWNCDGELVKSNHISAKCHPRLLQVFGLDSPTTNE